MEATADELETKDGLLSGCGGGGNADPSTTIVGRAQQFYSVLTSSLEVNTYISTFEGYGDVFCNYRATHLVGCS